MAVDDLTRKRMENVLRRLLAEDSIEFAGGDRIEEFTDEVSEVLSAIAMVTHESGIVDARVSDESCIGDFLASEGDDELTQLSEILGRPVSKRELIWEVAARLRAERAL
jgi:hypothetical protein